MSSNVHDVFAEDGVAAVETSIVFFVIFLFIMFTYELLKFQTDMSLIYINETLATEKMDMALLGTRPKKLNEDYLLQLNSTASNGLFNSLQYSMVDIKCYPSLEWSNFPQVCAKGSKIIKITYQVRRRFVNKWLCDLVNLPVNSTREVLAINDYYH